MSKPLQIVLRWLPALFTMLIIFLVSAQPSSNLPSFNWADNLVKKGGHMIGYALLAIGYWRGLGFTPKKWPLAWLLAVLYAVTDEFHQSFVPGRFASLWDVLIFDNLGALVPLLLSGLYKAQRPDAAGPIAEQVNSKPG
jgi:VanZ family protein